MKKIVSVLLLALMVCLVAIPAFATEASFTVFTDEEYDWLYFEMGSNNSGGSRFNDAYGYVIYEFPIAEGDTVAQLSWKIRNQYKVSVTNTDPDDPDAFEVIHEAAPTEEELANGTANWGDYGVNFITVHDLSKWCIDNPTGKIWVMMEDADPTNGWGGFIYNDTPVTFYSGSEAAPEVEQPKTVEEMAAETLAKYTFADGAQYFICNTEGEKAYGYKLGGSINGSFDRFHDGAGYSIYAFDVKASDTQAILHGAFNNQWDIRATMGDPEDIASYTPIATATQTDEEISNGNADWGNRVTSEDILDENGEVIDTITNYPIMDLDLSSVLNGKDGKLYVYIGDVTTENGWGGLICFDYPVVFSNAPGACVANDGSAVEEAPAEEVAAPVEEVAAPAEEIAAPAEEVVAPAETEAPVVEAPQTFDAAIIAAVAAIVSLAGYAVSKKH